MPAPIEEEIRNILLDIDNKLDAVIDLLSCIRECEQAEWVAQTGGDHIPHIPVEDDENG